MRTRRYRDDLGIFGLPGDVTPRDVRFDPADRAFLDRESDGRFRIRCHTEPDLVDATLVVRHEGAVRGFELDLVAVTARHAIWEIVAGLEPGDEFSLAFRTREGRAIYFVPTGISNAVERLDRWALPDLAPIGVPSWIRGAVIYQIFPDRFANGDPSNDPAEVDPWGSPPRHRAFQGGDLAGVREHLDYLANLGVDVIYLNPVFLSPSNHRYDAVDYEQVDPMLGGNEALSSLVGSAHERGMRIVLDVSLNHCHPRFFAFQDLVKNGEASAYRDWFVVRDWPLRIKVRPPLRGWQAEWLPIWAGQAGIELDYVDDPGPAVEPTYEAWYGVPTMPRVNLADPGARAYMLEIGSRWVSEFEIDGWRLDVARYVDFDFWTDFRQTVRKANPDAYLLAEIFGDAGAWVQGDRFDATMNYTFRDICLKFLARGDADAREASDALVHLWALYSWPVTLANQNLLGSHDTVRFLTAAGDEIWRLELATLLQLTYPGAPGVYYGDEIGMTGKNDPGCRRAFDWNRDPLRHPLAQMIASLTDLRRRHPSLVEGEWRPLPSKRNLLAFSRRLGREALGIFINRGSRTRVSVGGAQKVLWGNASLEGDTLIIPPRSGAIIEIGRTK
ncbi:MAG TPA: glycoside hydrolase family 13 protein [Acidimicrobiia bacterium]|nr:glycoside hydrolase family 13 protein [Acidimicrobiia bacterium]